MSRARREREAKVPPQVYLADVADYLNRIRRLIGIAMGA
jgi:hypothetical protein